MNKTMAKLKKLLVRIKELDSCWEINELKLTAARIGLRYNGEDRHVVVNMVLRILRA